MTVEEIVKFLNEKPGYAKEGAKRLANKVLKGKASIENCKTALRIFNGVNNIVEEEKEYFVQFDKPLYTVNETVNEYKMYPFTPEKGMKSEYTNSKVTFSNCFTEQKNTKPSPEMKLRSRWQNTNGEWLESYRAVPEEEKQLTKEDIESSIKAALENTQSYERKFAVSESKKSLLVWTSDKHIGADTSDAQHDNFYNDQVFMERMEILARNIVIKSNELNGLDTLVVADLGDATDGQDGYTASRTHRLPQNLTNKQVFETYITTHIQFIDFLIGMNVANNYQFWFNTNSNHGGSYEYACHKALQIYIATRYPFVKIESFDNFLGHTKFKGVTYILTHGKDDKNRKFGLPLYPDAKTEVFIDNYLKMNKLSFDENIRLIKGDLHQSASVPCKNINKYRNVASMFGSSGWVMDNFGFTPAGTDYEILDEITGEILEGTFWY